MVDVRIILSALWGCLVLVFLLGDVLRIFAGDFVTGELAGRSAPPWMWVLIAAIMLTPIVMIALSLVVPYPAIRWICVVAAAIGRGGGCLTRASTRTTRPGNGILS